MLHSMSTLHSMSMLHVHVYVHVHVEMPAVWHPVSQVTDCKKLMMPEQVWYWTKQTQSGILLFRYRNKIRDTGMPIPALVSSMRMPSY
jgi:hypothetical protein